MRPAGLDADAAQAAFERADEQVREVPRSTDGLVVSTVSLPSARIGRQSLYYVLRIRRSSTGRGARRMLGRSPLTDMVSSKQAPTGELWRESYRRPADESESAHREAPHPFHLHRHREEPEPLIRQLRRATQVLDDRDPRAQQDRMGGARAVRVVVNVERIDPNEGGVTLREQLSRGTSQERMAQRVTIRAPVRVPAGVQQHGLPPQVPAAKARRVERATISLGRPDHNPRQVRHRLKRISGDVRPILEAMKRGVDVRTGVREHPDLADLESRAGAITGARGLAAQPIVDNRRGEALVGHHPVLDAVAEVDQPGRAWTHGAAGGVASTRARARSRGPSGVPQDRKSTRLNSSHGYISYAVFCLKKKNEEKYHYQH